ncbi:LOW QUALITY PROTEIN: polyserase-2-like, partial [Menidia menidia]
CGRAPLNSRIVGGGEAPPGSWPWKVSMNIFGIHICGGALINRQWVLTSVHCISFPSYLLPGLTLTLGRQSQLGPNPAGENDLALLRLSAPVNFSATVAPVCLAAANSSFHSGLDAWIKGWGQQALGVAAPDPQNLTEVDVPIVGNRQCNCDYGEGSITENMLCAGLRAGGKGPCLGDGGGPLVVKQGDRWVQAGIASFSRGCAEPGFPSVYTRVSRYQDWISAVLGAAAAPPARIRPLHLQRHQPGPEHHLPPARHHPGEPHPHTHPHPHNPIHTVGVWPDPGEPPPPPPACWGGRGGGAGRWPWMASLQRGGRHVCGGALVSADSVLSSAACFSSPPVASDWTVVLGRTRQNGSNPFEQRLNVSAIALSNRTGSNVAVLVLSTRPVLTPQVQPLCLGRGGFPVGTRCWAAGWSSGRGGEEQVLQEVRTTVQSCEAGTANDSICTGELTLEQGDAGGPLMCNLDGSWFQAAVLPAPNSSARRRQEAVSVFERVSRFESFLVQTLGEFLSPPPVETTANPSANPTANATTSAATKGSSLSLGLLALAPCLRLFF